MNESALDARIERIAEKLRRAAAEGFRPFGVEGHGWRLESPLSEAEVAAAEARCGVTLPAGYRAFVTRVAGGGAGPAYGMFTLAQALANEGRPLPDDFLRIPFRHTAAFNPDADPVEEAFWERADVEDVPDEEIRRHILYQTAGTLNLCHEGCGYYHFLVVTGPARGQMWIDNRATDYGFAPLGADFLDWYERWLDDTLAGGRGAWWFG